MKIFFVRRWFFIALAINLTVGITFATQLEALSDIHAIRYGIVATVLFLMALPLKPGAIGRTLRRPLAPLLASAINYGLLPIFAWGLAILLRQFGLSDEMVLGLLVAAATPCTLASASVWTRRAGGNDSVSMLVTVLTNLSCFFITPLWLLWMTGKEPNSEELQLGLMILKLGLLVVLPMSLAQIARRIGDFGSWATEQITLLGVLAQLGVLSMIFLGAIRTGLRISNANGGSLVLVEIAVAVAAVLTIHLTFFSVGMFLSKLCRLPRADRIAVAFSGSQKTLMIGLQVSLDMGASAIPIVAYHVGQLLVDTLIADRFRRRTEEGAK